MQSAFELSFVGVTDVQSTAVAICNDENRIYLGLKGGLLEERATGTFENEDEETWSTVACKPLFVHVRDAGSLYLPLYVCCGITAYIVRASWDGSQSVVQGNKAGVGVTWTFFKALGIVTRFSSLWL